MIATLLSSSAITYFIRSNFEIDIHTVMLNYIIADLHITYL